MASNEAKAEQSSGKGRGPSYPVVNLRTAVERVQTFFKKEGKALVHTSVAVAAWNFSEKSSGGRQMIATLLQYGLLRDEGSGEQRSVAVSNLALQILLHEEGSSEHLRAIQAAARSPKLFTEILANFSTGLPSDQGIKRFLIMEKNVTPDAADGIVKNFRDTIAYSKLPESPAAKTNGEGAAGAGAKQQSDAPEVGDLIQWEPGGVLQFESARRVRAIQPADDGTTWLFVEGSETGIPAHETAVVERAGKPPIVPPTLPEPIATVQRLQNGERELLRGPLSKDVTYRLLVTGELGSRELGKLIRLLEAQKLVLDDDEE